MRVAMVSEPASPLASLGGVDAGGQNVTGVHEAIARALADLLTRPGVRAAMGAAGLARARRRYGWDTVAQRTLGVYARIADARRMSPLAREV